MVPDPVAECSVVYHLGDMTELVSFGNFISHEARAATLRK